MSEEPRNAMEGRARRRASQVGTGIRTKAVRVEPEPPPTKRHELGTRVAVVYYLCRNHHLEHEHPHFMEVPLASPQGLYLQDVICRLDALRGKGMAAKYSWSRKRSYKNGFVWHDLSVDDLLLPTEGTEYVLKGSKILFDQSKPPLPLPDHQQNSTTNNFSIALLPSSGASSASPNKPVAAHDAATQTDGKASGEDNAKLQRRQDTQERPEIAHESRFMPPPAREYPRSRRSGTLQSLIRAEAAGRRRGLLVLEEDEKATTDSITISGRLKPANLLMRMRLMACGPVQTSYKPRFTQIQYPLSLELNTLGALKPGTTSSSTVSALLHDRK